MSLTYPNAIEKRFYVTKAANDNLFDVPLMETPCIPTQATGPAERTERWKVLLAPV